MYACYVSKGTGWMSWEGKIVTKIVKLESLV